MSGALNSVYNNVTFALQLHSRTLASLQENVSTGSRINRTSDDPSSAYRILDLNSQQRYLANYIKNIESAMDTQDMTTSILQNMATTVMDTRTHLTQIISGTYSEGQGGQQARERIAQEINDVLEEMISSANTKYTGQYIFGGENTTSMPYAVERNGDGEIISVTYQGSLDARRAQMAPEVLTNVSYVGNDMFRMDNRSTTVFYGSTGASAGTGTSNIKGEVWLTVTHNGTSYELSIDDGATTVDVADAADITNVAVTNANGDILYVNAQTISATGTDKVKVSGTYDLFNILINTRDLLRDQRGLPATTLSTLINEAATAMEDVRSILVEKEASIGSNINFLNSLKVNLENVKANESDEATQLQEADIAQLAIDIAQRETLYQMSLSVAGKLMSMSILDFIR